MGISSGFKVIFAMGDPFFHGEGSASWSFKGTSPMSGVLDRVMGASKSF